MGSGDPDRMHMKLMADALNYHGKTVYPGEYKEVSLEWLIERFKLIHHAQRAYSLNTLAIAGHPALEKERDDHTSFVARCRPMVDGDIAAANAAMGQNSTDDTALHAWKAAHIAYKQLREAGRLPRRHRVRARAARRPAFGEKGQARRLGLHARDLRRQRPVPAVPGC